MPVARLTAVSVTRLPAVDSRRTDYTDSLLPGFLLRVTPTGARTFAIYYYKGSQKIRRTLGPIGKLDLADARVIAGDMLKRIARGLPLEPRRGSLTVAKLVEKALADLKLRPSTRKEWKRLAEKEIVAIGSRPAADLRRADVREWARGIKRRSGWTANHAFELLRRAYAWGIVEELVEFSPCDRMPKPFEGESSDRVLTDVELWALGRNLDRIRSGYVDVVRLLLLTGVRRGSALGARRDEFHGLDGQDPRWIVPKGRSKSGREHVVPLSPAAVALVKARLEAVTGQHLFPIGGPHAGEDRSAGWSSRFRTLLKARVARTMAAKRRKDKLPAEPMPRWKVHGLRHAIATHLREDLGVDRDVVSLVLGHSLGGSRMTAVYDRSEKMPERRRALEAWAAWLAALGTERQAAKILPMRSR